MNKMKCLLAAFVVLVAMVGCGKKVDVALGTSTLNIAPEGESVEVALTSNGDWTIDVYPDWLAVSPTSGTGDATLTLTASLNSGDTSRSGELRVSTKDNSATLAVIQDVMQTDFIVVRPDSIECEAEGGNFTLEVTSNCDWVVNVSVDWMSCEPANGSGNGTVIVNILPMDGDLDIREANIFFTGAGNDLIPVHVVQHAEEQFHISVTPDMLSFEYVGGAQKVVVSSNCAWAVTTDVDWVSFDATSGNGDADLMVIVAESELVLEARDCNVSFVTETGESAVLVVKQEGAPDPHYLEVTPMAVYFEKDGGEAEITISCDEEWSVTAADSWISFSMSSGTGDGVVALTAEPNSINEARHTNVTVVSGYLSQRVIVTQEPGTDIPIVTISPDTLYVSSSGGLNHLSITSNTNWTLVSPNEWISFLTSSGTGDAELDFIVDLNESDAGRTGVVNIVHNLSVMGSVVVVQEGRPNILAADVIEINASPEGGEYMVSITANQAWNIQTSVNWLACYPSSGNNNGEFMVKIQPLTTIQSRSTELRIYGSNGGYLVIPVTKSN